MNRIEPLEPRSSGRLRQSADRAGMDRLIVEAKQQFRAEFAAATARERDEREQAHLDDESPRPSSSSQALARASMFPAKQCLGRSSQMARSSSVLGIRSDPWHEVDGNLKASRPPGSKSALDYVDLECLLQDKMRELNVQIPKGKSGRRKELSDAEAASSPTRRDAAESRDDGTEFALRVKEAAFLFRLCQQEIELQVKVSCPERARLIEKALDFWGCVLDCLLIPLDNTRAQMGVLRQTIASDKGLLKELDDVLFAWFRENSHLLDAAVWRQLPQQAGQTAAALHKSLRTLCKGPSSSTAAASPRLHSPSLLSRASTSGASSRPGSTRKMPREDGCKQDKYLDEMGHGEGGRGIHDQCEQGHAFEQQKELPGALKAVLACLAAAGQSLVQLQTTKEALEAKLKSQEHEHKQRLQDAIDAHQQELQQQHARMEEEQLAHESRHKKAAQELEATRTARSDADALSQKLQTQVDVLQKTVEDLKASAAAASAQSGARVQELEDGLAAAREACVGQEAEIKELERLAAEERASEQSKLTQVLSELDETRGQLARFTQDGVVLTPRPEWGRKGGDSGQEEEEDCSSAERVARLLRRAEKSLERQSALEADMASVTSEMTKAKEELVQARAVRLAAEDLVQKQAAELQAMRDRRVGTDASCGCPEPPEDPNIEMMELSEYLANYLSKRFGLQGHMASWEVEKVGKDLGWMMEMPVRSSVT